MAPAVAGTGMSPFFPVMILSAPTALIAIAAIALHQFKVFFVAFVTAASDTRGSPVWRAVQPFLADVARVMEQTLGRAAGFNPNLTHVLLTALLLAVMIGTERIRHAILHSSKGLMDRNF